MTDSQLTTPFQQHDLVWAKIQNYPWWPAKIIQIFEQKKSLFFKISFYADPTYCYLREDALIAFDQFQYKMNQSYHIDQQLQKAIILANNAFSKRKLIEQQQQQQQNNHHLKLHSTQGRQLTPMPLVDELVSEIPSEQPSKGEEFQQSTIHIDFQTEHCYSKNGKTMKFSKANEIRNLLTKYKLHKIPALVKEEKIIVEQKAQVQIPLLQFSSDEEEKVELFDFKNVQKRKYIKKNTKRKGTVKKRLIGKLSKQELKNQLMKRLCSILISKGIDSQISRQITVKMMEKTELITQKFPHGEIRKSTLENVSIKLFTFLTRIDVQLSYEEKLVYIFSSIDNLLYQMTCDEEKEEERTNVIVAQDDEVAVMC